MIERQAPQTETGGVCCPRRKRVEQCWVFPYKPGTLEPGSDLVYSGLLLSGRGKRTIIVVPCCGCGRVTELIVRVPPASRTCNCALNKLVLSGVMAPGSKPLPSSMMYI